MSAQSRSRASKSPPTLADLSLRLTHLLTLEACARGKNKTIEAPKAREGKSPKSCRRHSEHGTKCSVEAFSRLQFNRRCILDMLSGLAVHTEPDGESSKQGSRATIVATNVFLFPRISSFPVCFPRFLPLHLRGACRQGENKKVPWRKQMKVRSRLQTGKIERNQTSDPSKRDIWDANGSASFTWPE